uniref:Looped-hinge helix DNA binding domain-containing protein, AbrB family n=1 Tax=Candidatus Kentrum sp. FW TaxID=2126338 RepID=A0A450SM52_9GAMM|nr:MAG: looped-hinge helix DNA binding domain-containing protein, AbrB family [Candidatus Kentron sp. FW]
MLAATVTSKGQITIPKSVRDALCLQVGDRVAFVVHGQGALLTPISKSVDEVFGMLKKPDISPRTIEEMNRAVRTRARSQES